MSSCSAGRIAHCEGPRPSFACPYIRVSFASATDADLQEGIKRLATVIRSFQQEPAAGPHSNGTASGRCDHAAANGSLSNGNAEDGKQTSMQRQQQQQHSSRRSVQQIVHDNEEMGLDAAVHTAANSQPEAC